MSTGVWYRLYRLDADTLFKAVCGGRPTSHDPGREWGGLVVGADEQARLQDLERRLATAPTLTGVVWREFSFGERLLAFKECDLDHVLAAGRLLLAAQGET